MAETKKKLLSDRNYMEMAVEVMKASIQEPRTDKVSPKVGAVLIKPNGEIETASRGELRHGDHAEFTLLERKNRSNKLDGSILFATLEPCAPGARKHPKLCCAERIVNARIKKVYIGIEDPDPTVDKMGIKFLQEHGIEIVMFDSDLQSEIREENKQFIIEAEIRAKTVKEPQAELVLSEKEKVEFNSELGDLNEKAINNFLLKAKIEASYGSNDFFKIFQSLKLIEINNGTRIPTGMGLLLFADVPQSFYPHAMIKATYRTGKKGEQIENFNGSLVDQLNNAMEWFERVIGHQIDRNNAHRQVTLNYPGIVIREALANAVVHRNYDIEGAPIYFEINDDFITIKSPGEPVAPLKIEQIKNFTAPSLSRNPKIMYIFEQLNLVEQRGLGFTSIKELPKNHNLPLPVVSYDAPYMVIKFPRTNEAVRQAVSNEGINDLSTEELAGYNWLRTQTEVSTSEYASAMRYSQRTASRHLASFISKGLAETNGENSRSKNLRYKAV